MRITAGTTPRLIESEADTSTPGLGVPLVMLVAPLAGIFLNALGQSVLSTALPTVASSVGGLGQLPWLVTSYLTAFAVGVPLFGWLGDDRGRRGTLIAAVLIFTIGSVAAATSTTMAQLVLARIVQGFGGGGLTTIPSAMMGDLVSPRRRGTLIAYGVVTHLTASIVGPIVGGLLTDHVSWRLVFLAPLPIGLVAIVGTRNWNAIGRPFQRSVFDLRGFTLLSLAIVAVTLSLSTFDPPSAAPTRDLVLAVVALVTIVASVRNARRANALIPASLMRRPMFSVAAAITFGLGLVLAGILTFLPTFMQLSMGLSASRSGMLLLPLMVGVVATSVPAGRYITRVGRYRALPIIGTGLITLAAAGMASLDGTSSEVVVALLMVAIGCGTGLSLPVLLLVAQNAAPSRQMGLATSVHYLSRELGGALGVAASGIAWNASLTLAIAQGGVRSDAGALKEALVEPGGLADLGPGVAELLRGAVSGATASVMLLMAAAMLGAHVLTWRVRNTEMRTVI